MNPTIQLLRGRSITLSVSLKLSIHQSMLGYMEIQGLKNVVLQLQNVIYHELLVNEYVSHEILR